MIKSLVDKLINAVFKSFLQKKERYTKLVEEFKLKHEVQKAERIENLVAEGQTTLNSIKSRWENGSSGLFPTLFAIRRIYNKFSELDESLKPAWREFIESITFIVVVVFFLRHFILALYHVPTGSAEPNILV